MYIENIQGPEDVKRLSLPQLQTLATEIRTALLSKISAHGGHFGPNFGMVEATIALHYVFNSPKDKFVFDVSHQTYPHKMLTGRKNAFLFPQEYDEVSGYSEPSESPHDHFIIGHTSTSVSLASGLAKSRDLKGEKENIIAIIGDGSLSGGEAFEGFDFAATLHSNFIIVVNDNQMSIAENHGGIYANLQTLRETEGKAACNLFKAMGFDYRYVADGNDIASLIDTFKEVKDIDHPVVVHINTVKGKGYAPAEADKETYHYRQPFNTETGELLHPMEGDSMGDLTARYLLQRMKEDPTVCVINAATPSIFGFTPDRRKQAGSQYVDVGIAEEQAVAMGSGMAKAGARPVLNFVSTFIQRAYDQLSQDLCINTHNPAVILVHWAGLTVMNDVTHLCWFDIPLLSNIPNLLCLAPTSTEEYFDMLAWAMRQNDHHVVIRVPLTPVHDASFKPSEDYSKPHYKVTRQGKEVALLGLGTFYAKAQKVAVLLKENGVDATLINPRCYSELDIPMLETLRAEHTIVATLEDGCIEGGFGEKVSRFYGSTSMKVLNFGGKKQFADRFDPTTFLEENHLTEAQITADILHTLRD